MKAKKKLPLATTELMPPSEEWPTSEDNPPSEGELAARKWPEADALLDKLSGALSECTDLYRHTAIELRRMDIPSRQLSALLLHWGLSKTQASKLKRIVEARDDLFRDYVDKRLGLNATLNIARSYAGAGRLPAAVETLFEKLVDDLIAREPNWRAGKTAIKRIGWTVEVCVKYVPTPRERGHGAIKPVSVDMCRSGGHSAVAQSLGGVQTLHLYP